jgi:hypothetical protein
MKKNPDRTTKPIGIWINTYTQHVRKNYWHKCIKDIIFCPINFNLFLEIERLFYTKNDQQTKFYKNNLLCISSIVN